MKGIFEQILLILAISISLVSTLTTEDRIRKHGYPVEKHTTQTKDGYILTMFRIPHSPRNNQQNLTRPIAFLQHGILSSSDGWILNGPGLALPYMLVEDGYDVWLVNNRGNTYSRSHASYSTLNNKFWDFDWHEIAIFDMPAMIDYILETTGQHSLHFVGHSQGTTVLLVMTSMIPSYNQKIKSAQLLAPVAFMDNLRGPLMQFATPLLGQLQIMVRFVGGMELLPNSFLLKTLKNLICLDVSLTKEICSNLMFLFFGWNQNNVNKNLLEDIMQTHPAGSSVKQVVHYLQEYVSGEFRQYDYGSWKNLYDYAQSKPPNYDLKKVTMPIYIYYGDNDYFSHFDDVQRLMMNLSNVKYSYRVPDKNWNHLDHLWAHNAKEVIFERVLENVNKMESDVIY